MRKSHCFEMFNSTQSFCLRNPVNLFSRSSFPKQVRGSTDGSGSDGAVCDRRRLAGRRLLCAATHSLPSGLPLLDVRACWTPVQTHQALHGTTHYTFLHICIIPPICLSACLCLAWSLSPHLDPTPNTMCTYCWWLSARRLLTAH